MSLKSSLRSIVYQTEKRIQIIRFASLPQDLPALLGISFPKSGTHLLDQILLGFANVAPYARRFHSFYAEYEGDSGVKREPRQALQWLDSLRERDVASAHLFARTEVVTRVCSSKFIPYFIFRDPRDVVVSHVFYVTEMESRHVHHEYYQSLPDFDARLTVSILGRPDPSTLPSVAGRARFEFPNIAERFAPYVGWLDQPEVLTIHFEDLIHDRVQTLNRIIDHFVVRVSLPTSRKLILDSLESSINPAKSPTFRSGRAGGWNNHFTEEHKKIFKDATGDLLIRLGYEKNNDW